jgi:hypothetical protein
MDTAKFSEIEETAKDFTFHQSDLFFTSYSFPLYLVRSGPYHSFFFNMPLYFHIVRRQTLGSLSDL